MNDRLRAQESRAALADLRERLSAVNNDLRTALQAAQNFQDPDGYLTEEGTRERQRQMRELAQQTFGKKMDALQAEQAQHLARVRSWAETKRPKLPDDPGQISLTLAAWDRAKAMLDAGHSIPAVLERATSPATAIALREWGGDWLMASQPHRRNVYGMDNAPDTTGLVRSADDRLAQLMGGETAEAIAMLRDADASEGAWKPLAGFVADALTTGRPQDGQALMAAAIESHYAEQMARTGYQEPEAVPSTAAPEAAA